MSGSPGEPVVARRDLAEVGVRSASATSGLPALVGERRNDSSGGPRPAVWSALAAAAAAVLLVAVGVQELAGPGSGSESNGLRADVALDPGSAGSTSADSNPSGSGLLEDSIGGGASALATHVTGPEAPSGTDSASFGLSPNLPGDRRLGQQALHSAGSQLPTLLSIQPAGNIGMASEAGQPRVRRVEFR